MTKSQAKFASFQEKIRKMNQNKSQETSKLRKLKEEAININKPLLLRLLEQSENPNRELENLTSREIWDLVSNRKGRNYSGSMFSDPMWTIYEMGDMQKILDKSADLEIEEMILAGEDPDEPSWVESDDETEKAEKTEYEEKTCNVCNEKTSENNSKCEMKDCKNIICEKCLQEGSEWQNCEECSLLFCEDHITQESGLNEPYCTECFEEYTNEEEDEEEKNDEEKDTNQEEGNKKRKFSDCEHKALAVTDKAPEKTSDSFKKMKTKTEKEEDVTITRTFKFSIPASKFKLNPEAVRKYEEDLGLVETKNCKDCQESGWWCTGSWLKDLIIDKIRDLGEDPRKLSEQTVKERIMKKLKLDEGKTNKVIEYFEIEGKGVIPCYSCNSQGKDKSNKMLKLLKNDPDFWN